MFSPVNILNNNDNVVSAHLLVVLWKTTNSLSLLIINNVLQIFSVFLVS